MVYNTFGILRVYAFAIQFFFERDGIRLINKYLLFAKNNINISKYL